MTNLIINKTMNEFEKDFDEIISNCISDNLIYRIVTPEGGLIVLSENNYNDLLNAIRVVGQK